MILKLVDKDDPVLSKKTEKFDFNNPPMDPEELFKNLKETMIANRGVGLAANQVGIPYSVFVVGNPDDEETIFSVFNPIIVDMSLESMLTEEGCLSYPGLYVKVKRPSIIRARYTNFSGNTNTIKFGGMTSRIFQHEMDHLEGVCHLDRANKIHLDQAMKQKKQMDRKKKNNAK